MAHTKSRPEESCFDHPGLLRSALGSSVEDRRKANRLGIRAERAGGDLGEEDYWRRESEIEEVRRSREPRGRQFIQNMSARLAIRFRRKLRWPRGRRLRLIRLVPRLGGIGRLGHVDDGWLTRASRQKRRIGKDVRCLHGAPMPENAASKTTAGRRPRTRGFERASS